MPKAFDMEWLKFFTVVADLSIICLSDFGQHLLFEGQFFLLHRQL